MADYDEDRDLELFARADYIREAYGDPCPGCGTLRWQADCPLCMPPEDEPDWATHRDDVPEFPTSYQAPASPRAPVPATGEDDDDIPF